MPLTAWVSQPMTMGAVVPLPSFSKPFLVAILTILDARTGPQVKSHCAHTATAPESMSPKPPQRFFPPSVLTINDFRLLRIRSQLPFTKRVKPSHPSTPSIQCTSSLLRYFSNMPSTCILRMSFRKVISLALGVRMGRNLFRSCMSSGCLLRKYMPSASRIVSAPQGRFLMRTGKNSLIYLSLPRPGPITHVLIAFRQVKIFPSHSPCAILSYSAVSFTSASETKTGCTIISGEQALMEEEALLEQKMCARSPPTFSEEMAAQKGAPENQRDPPMTATLPLSPFRRVGSRGGKTPVSMPNNSVLFDIISLYSGIIHQSMHMWAPSQTVVYALSLFHLLDGLGIYNNLWGCFPFVGVGGQNSGFQRGCVGSGCISSCSSKVEQRPPKPKVVGSIPITDVFCIHNRPSYPYYYHLPSRYHARPLFVCVGFIFL